ncbi:MAG: hypothetical protein ACLSCV_06205 [Acutalibacteraceae bacterium]
MVNVSDGYARNFYFLKNWQRSKRTSVK